MLYIYIFISSTGSTSKEQKKRKKLTVYSCTHFATVSVKGFILQAEFTFCCRPSSNFVIQATLKIFVDDDGACLCVCPIK